MSKNNSNTKLSISQTKPIPNSGQEKPLNVTLRNCQNIGITGSLLALGYSNAGQKIGYLKPETAKKINLLSSRRVRTMRFFLFSMFEGIIS